MTKVSPLAPKAFPHLPEIAGVRFAAKAAGIKYKERVDLMLAAFDPGTQVAGVFTRSKTASAPVDWCKAKLAGGVARALVVNSGNANAFTGRAGQSSVDKTAAAAAALLNCDPGEVFLASTGVIGERLPDDVLTSALADMPASLDGGAWDGAARAIMTTDTFPKGATATATINGTPVTINGFAKGSGMIAPDMATMLGFVFTDAALPANVLQALLSAGTDTSFNAITVDSDTSTSDTVLLFATGRAGNTAPADAAAPELADFRNALNAVLLDMAHQIVRDGEGASKFIAITVEGAESDRAAKRVGLSIANSPLVKTAIAGEDANWGRIVMAVGKAGEAADRDKLAIAIGGVTIADAGEAVEGYDEAPVAEHMKGQDIDVRVDLGIGPGRATVWTCDLTHDYISINADYRS